MHITKYTDYSLRTLAVLSPVILDRRGGWFTPWG